MSKPSSTAGKACVECGIPDPCLMDVITDFPENEEHHVWSKEGIVHFELLDEGEGCDGTITIESKWRQKQGARKHGWKSIKRGLMNR